MSKIKLYLLLLAIYALIATIFTWPMPLHPNTNIYGYPGDSLGTLWRLRWYKDARETGQTDFSYNPNLAAPFGTYFAEEVNPVVYLEPLKFITYLTNEVFAYNFIIFLSFVLTPLFTFSLLQYLTKSKAAAFIGSLIFNLAPYHFWQAFNHPDLAQIQWLPLYILALLNLEKKKNFKAAFLAAGVYLIALYTSFYYGYFLALFTIIFLTGKIIFEKLNFHDLQQRFLPYLVFGLLVFIFLFPTFQSIFTAKVTGETSSATTTTRSLDDLVAMSARPWDYLVPSINHPLFGKYTQKFYEQIKNEFSDFKGLSTFVQERTIYLGIANLFLAMVGISIWLVRAFQRKSKTFLPFLFFVTALILALTSGPPYVGIRGHTIYLPSYYLFNLSSFLAHFRVYSRLGVMVLLCVTILSAYGIKYIFEILKRLKIFQSKLIQSIVYCLLSTIIVFDFLNLPPFNVTDISQIPECYQWLANQPGEFIIAENPDLYAYTDALLFQRLHKKRLFNIMGGRLHDAIWPLVMDINSNDHVDHLKAFGVKYIFLHTKNIFFPDYLDQIRYLRTAKALEEKNMPKNLEISQQCSEGVIYKIKDFQPKDKIYVIRESSEQWFPGGDWIIERGVNQLFLANATEKSQMRHLIFETDKQAKLEIRIDNSGQIIKIEKGIITIPPGLTRVIIINKTDKGKIILRNLELKKMI